MKLKGAKVILRPIRLSDASRFVKWLSDSEVNQYTTRRPVSLKEEKKWIRSLKMTSDLYFAIDTSDGTHIGSVTLYLESPRDKRAKFGILIGDKNYWNKGYGTDAAKTVINYGFRRLNLHRIYLGVFEYNKRALKAYKKLGFKTEGAQRNHIFYKGKFYDEFIMGLLRSEWQN